MIATFDVQNVNLTEKSGQVCFTCYFIEGSQSQGCYIEYNSFITDYYSGNITIVRTSVDTSTANKCVTGIYTSNYNVSFYDMDYNNVPYTTEYAVKLTNQSVTGLSPPHTSTLTTISSVTVIITLSSITNVISSSPSPTTLCTDCDNSKLLLILQQLLLHLYVCYIDDTQVDKSFITAAGILGGNEYDNNINTSSHIIIS